VSLPAPATAEPSHDCPLCPRLVAFREKHRAVNPDWHNAPVPSFGPPDAPLLIVGLAPGLRGANRTGRPFTGDYAGDLLYATLIKYGFARGDYRADPGDGLELVGCRITNAVRCVPPENKPEPLEVTTCRRFLAAELARGPKAVLALGQIAHTTLLATLAARRAAYPFVHGRMHEIGPLLLADSYHCSRYNTNTGRLTAAMFEAVIAELRRRLPALSPAPA
jgi:uracil-DNA glycosylase family 4